MSKHNVVGRFAGKVAFVQGGSRGIGAAIVKRLAREGATVAFTYVAAEDRAKAVVTEVEQGGGRALAIRADSGDPAALKAAIDKTASAFGGLDILVNNAAIARMAPLESFPLDNLDRSYEVNVRSVFAATQAASPHLREGGRVITIGSVNADRMPMAGGAAYAMSKAAVAGLTRGLARDLGARKITVNNVQLGPVDTDMNPDGTDFASTLKSSMALGRYGHADEAASFVAYLASEEAAYVTGASLDVDGGFLA